ncbi:alpha-amylase family glycosyl hydrolase [Desulfogranum japonicum]|uniref:alpha-amylase family glycosyl hydrolase n=1 Tax=Desulfogranum japonicum TaxID=231447 RepID=UPI001376FC4A|nr:alpha-amylase family glycosyl hydrolase [Desulfogranum japonicum]
MSEGATRVVTKNPFATAKESVRIHLITAKKYREGRIFIWSPGSAGRLLSSEASDEYGPIFDISLTETERHWFLFKFVSRAGVYEPDYANRLWVAQDGEEIWVHSQAPAISTEQPVRKPLTIHAFQPGPPATPLLHLWQEDSDFVLDVSGTPDSDGWMQFEYPVYTGRTYRFMLHDPNQEKAWESGEAKRNVHLSDDGVAWTYDGDGTRRKLGKKGVWTLEGDHELFGHQPHAEKEVCLEIAACPPNCDLQAPLLLDVWVNRSRALLYTGLAADEDGCYRFKTYPEVVTSFHFRSSDSAEFLERHFLKVSNGEDLTHRYIVLNRADTLPAKPLDDLFSNPPFPIERPGAWIADGQVRFAVHCPTAAAVEVVGDWTDWEASPLPMRSTEDGTYWWAHISVAKLTAARGGSLHGALYKFRLNQVRLVQDPAADWVENSAPERASKLVDHQNFPWSSNGWQRPGWQYLNIYQLHPSMFSKRAGHSGLNAVTHEMTAPEGYLRKVNATAILLMPTCEFSGDHGWGYNPSFFYSVESAYGGPDALKRLVDACHQNGKAVLLDVVFNHASTSDNVLWSVARDSFFDGDTEWGAMINFDHPQVMHFFERNLVHFMQNYKIDGFRFDFTRVIRFGDQWTAHVRQPGSGGGWKFMQRLRKAVHKIDGRCLLMAENLPNDWDLTHSWGPMDTQWCDEFHDRLVDAVRGWDVMGNLADALKITQASDTRWHESTNYAESHDEVGNEPNRISAVAGPGQGLRRSKVASAATLLARGIPLSFMGAETGEWRQFPKGGDQALDLDYYEHDTAACCLRNWWNRLSEIRRGNPRLEGPSPLRVTFAQDRMLAFTRGEANDLFVLLNFGNWSGWRSLAELNLPEGEYKELVNSTWGAYRISCEGEDEDSNGGWDARLHRGNSLHIPDYGAVILEKR